MASYYGASGILDAEGMSVAETVKYINSSPVIVAMGANPSASSTPKVQVSEEIASHFPRSSIIGLHYGNMPRQDVLRSLRPHWDMVDFTKYRPHNWHLFTSNGGYYGIIYTSFGCPFNCSYCNIHSLYKSRKVTFRNPEEVINEIQYLVERGVRDLKIADELFVLNPEHVNEICDRLIEKDWGLNIWAYARVDTVNPKLLNKLKKAGVNWLAYGFESADERVRAGVGKSFKNPDAAIEMTRNAGINIIGNFIFGLPED